MAAIACIMSPLRTGRYSARRKVHAAICLLVFFGVSPVCIAETGAGMSEQTEKLSPCPDSPNCVQSEYPDHKSYLKPLDLQDKDPGEILQVLQQVLDDMPRSRIVEQQSDYLRAEFTSRIFKFVDDLELRYDPAAGVMHIRSASRSGYYDFGVNRKRVEYIRAALYKSFSINNASPS